MHGAEQMEILVGLWEYTCYIQFTNMFIIILVHLKGMP